MEWIVADPLLTFFRSPRLGAQGKFGRLGHGAERNCHSPRLVESLLGKRPIQIACGGFHSAVVTQDGKSEYADDHAIGVDFSLPPTQLLREYPRWES
jgi:hypothetical protein